MHCSGQYNQLYQYSLCASFAMYEQTQSTVYHYKKTPKYATPSPHFVNSRVKQNSPETPVNWGVWTIPPNRVSRFYKIGLRISKTGRAPSTINLKQSTVC